MAESHSEWLVRKRIIAEPHRARRGYGPEGLSTAQLIVTIVAVARKPRSRFAISD
jgi:hypothetical protein